MIFWDNSFSFLVKVKGKNQNLKFLHWASILIGNLCCLSFSGIDGYCSIY